MKKATSIQPALLAVTIISFVLQDLALKKYFGTIASSPAAFITPALFIFLIVYEKKIYFSSIIKSYFLYAFVTTLSAVLILVYTFFFVTHGDLRVYDEFMPVKLIKASFYNTTFFFAAYVLFSLAKNISTTSIYRILNAVLWVLIFYGILQAVTNIQIPFINGTESGETARIRLATPEPSIAAPLFITIAVTVIALRLYLKRGNVITYILAIVSIGITILIGSKGSILLLPFALAIAVRKKLTLKIILPAVLIIAFFVVVIINKIIPMFAADIESFNSISTRSTTWLAAFESLFIYPFGQGYGTYLLYYPPMLLPVNSQIVQITGVPLLTNELTDMIETGQNLAAKSGVANEIIDNGFFSVAFLWWLSIYYKRLTNMIAVYPVALIFSVLGIFLFISFTFSAGLDSAYYYLIPFMVLQKIVTPKEEPALIK